MIRPATRRAKWTGRKFQFLAGILVWLGLLLLCEYQHTLQGASRRSEGVGRITSASPPKPGRISPPLEAAGSGSGTAAAAGHDVGSQVPYEFNVALQRFEANLAVTGGFLGDPDQPTRNFTDIIEQPGFGVPLPHELRYTTDSKEEWEACDQRDADFKQEHNALCQAYLGNLNNMRYIRAMSSRLLYGRTIKFRLHYAHNNIEAIVKVSQRKFYYEAASEYVAFTVDRALNFSRIPTSVFVPLPLDYMRVATAHSTLFSQWMHRFILSYNYTNRNFIPCEYPMRNKANAAPLCAHVTIQLWMYDVHSALSSYLALPYEYDSAFVAKYYTPGHHLWPPKGARLRSIGDLQDRFIFDFLIGNSDRGMHDHNNFVYGGCSSTTVCKRPPKSQRIRGLAKYAFLDHGSSFYSHREPKGNAFFGDVERIPVCRFRRATYEMMRGYRLKGDAEDQPSLVMHVQSNLSPYIFQVIYATVFRNMQKRLEKVLRLVERCLERYPVEEVFSLPPAWEVAIPEEQGDEDESDEREPELGHAKSV